MKKVKEYAIITIGIILVALSLEFFFFPNGIASGGISGLALILKDLFGISTGTVMIISNIILFIVAFIFLGGAYGVKSIYAAFSLSFLLTGIERFNVHSITDNPMLATIFGSAIIAMGSAMVFSQGASTGGTSIIASILSKYCNMDIGKGVLISDSVVIILAIYTFGIELGLFGLLSVYLAGNLIDKFIDGFNSCKQVYIFTDKEDMIVEYIKNDIYRGCTVFKGKGGYSGNENTMILTVLDRKGFIKLKNYIRKNDPSAFITVNETSAVFGQGFTSLLE